MHVSNGIFRVIFRCMCVQIDQEMLAPHLPNFDFTTTHTTVEEIEPYSTYALKQ